MRTLRSRPVHPAPRRRERPAVRCAVVVAALLGLAAPASASFTPEAGSPIAVGADPYGIVAADFDGNGRPDLGAVNGTSSTLSVLVRQGATYAQEAGSPYATGSGPDFAATGDFNGDGRPDVAVANFVGGSVTVLLRQAGGGFAAAPGSPYGAPSASSVATADFNGDGRLDLAAPSLNGGFVTVLLGGAGGSFTPEAGTPATGFNPRNLAAADFNGDGRPDLAVTNVGSASVTILLRQAGGGFASESAAITVGDSPAGITAADFNGDGRPDLAVANSGSDTVSVLLRNPAGGFSAEGPAAVGDTPITVSAADLNGDGRPDLAVTNNTSGSVSVLLRQAAGGFVQDAGSPVAVTRAYGIVATDVDGDGRPDLAVTSDLAAGTVTVLRNTSPPTCTPQSATAPRVAGVTITPSCTGATSFRIVTRPRGGTVAGPDAAGRFTYTPSLQFRGTDAFTYEALSAGGASSGPQTVTIAVPAALPVPVAGRSTNVARSSGTVTIKVPGAKVAVRLTADAQVPLGTIVDTRKGRVTITLATSATKRQSGTFYDGRFQVLQTRGSKPVGVMRLVGGVFPGVAPKDDTTPAARPVANAAATKKKAKPVRRLWGDAKGAFRTAGRLASATVRGTKWLISDYATFTTVQVTRGVVAVRDFRRHRTVLVRAGQTYTVRR